ncbi:MAG TPA: hypothetical protein PLX23_01325, partial [Candidatus Hydrogenedens sp.]|nr:hypothetical protein [Candidatus Hydrogenedens sp.]
RGANYTGGRLACPVWVDFMMVAEKGLPVRNFTVPPGVQFFNINRATGSLGGSYVEAYVEGTAPPIYRPIPKKEIEPVPEEKLVEPIEGETIQQTAPPSIESTTTSPPITESLPEKNETTPPITTPPEEQQNSDPGF